MSTEESVDGASTRPRPLEPRPGLAVCSEAEAPAKAAVVSALPLTPILDLVLTGMMTWAAFRMRPQESKYALLSILAGVPFYYAWRLTAGQRPAGDRSLEQSKTPPGHGTRGGKGRSF